jgi:AraC-like DNA-binding protein
MDKTIFTTLTKKDRELPFYINTIGQFFNQNYIYRKNGDDNYHYIHTNRGKGKLIIRKKEYILKENMGFIINPNIAHKYFPIEEPWTTIWVTFNGYGVEKLMRTMFQNWLVFNLSAKDVLESLLEELFVLLSVNNKSNVNKCSAILYSFLMNLKDEIQSMDLKINCNKEDRLQIVIKYMEANFSKNILLADLANIINVSPQHLCKLFKNVYHIRPIEYLNMIRINKAKEILMNNKNYSIKEISKIVGFSNSNYFCYKFNEVANITALQFRNKFF